MQKQISSFDGKVMWPGILLWLQKPESQTKIIKQEKQILSKLLRCQISGIIYV